MGKITGIIKRGGPLVEITLSNPPYWQDTFKEDEVRGIPITKFTHGFALIDTGSAISVVKRGVADTLRAMDGGTIKIQGLTPPDQPWKKPIDGDAPARRIVISILGVTFKRTLICAALNLDSEIIAILGRDVLGDLMFFYDGPNKEWGLANP